MKISQRIAEHKGPFVSCEFFPPKEKAEWPGFFDTVEKLKALDPLFVSVTYGAGGSSQAATLDIVRRLQQDMGLETMAHLTCVGATEGQIGDFLKHLAESGSNNVMALRGDTPQNMEIDWEKATFRHGSDLVRLVRRTAPEFGIGVAVYPTPHPESPSFESDARYTVMKIREGADFGVTQLFFDVREYFHLVERLNGAGVSVPIIPGIFPVQSLAAVRRTLSLCGANIPGKLYLDLEAADAKGGSAAVKEAGLAFAAGQIRALIEGGAPGVHLYTMNRAETCLRLMDEVRDLFPRA